MSDTLYCFNRYHYGDCLQSLHLLRVFAKQVRSRPIVFFTNGHQISQLKEVVEDLPNILIEPFESPLWRDHERDAVDMWKNAEGFWEKSPHRWNWSEFMLSHHAWTAQRMGQHSPFTCREHLLLDYPALEVGHNAAPGYDFLIVNSEPCSGQFAPMKEHGSGYLDGLIEALFRGGKSIVLTSYCPKMDQWSEIEEPRGEIFVLGGQGRFSITQIGNLSIRCKNVLGVMTGPFWPCINTHRHHDSSKRTIGMLDNGEALNLPGVEQASSVEELFAIARTEGWL